MLIKSHNYSISLTGTCEYMQLIYACATVCDCICTIIFMSWVWIWLAARPSIPLCSTYFESCHLVPCVSWSNNLSRPTFWSQRNGRRGSWTNMRTVKYCQKDSGQQNLSFGMIAARCSTHFEFRSRIQTITATLLHCDLDPDSLAQMSNWMCNFYSRPKVETSYSFNMFYC